MILVDSSVWIDFFNGAGTPQTDRLDGLLGQQPLAIGDLILTEVLQGFRREQDYQTAKRLLLTLDVFALAGQHLAIRSAENYRSLRSRGITIRKTIDVVIATFCIEWDLALLHADKDFLPFERHLGLQSAV